MKAVYLETSALLAWMFGETAGVAVTRALDEAEVVVTSELTFVESGRAVRRALSASLVKEGDAQRLQGLLARQRSMWVTMSLSSSVLTRAGEGFPVEPVRTLDAIHLATALAFTEAFPELAILALDRRVSENATALGLASA